MEKVHQPDQNLKLGEVWRAIVLDTEGGYVPPLTKRELRQLKHFAGRCPEGTASQVLEWAVRHWTEFGQQVEMEVGGDAPLRPHAGYLLKHVGIAVNECLALNKPKPKPKPVPKLQLTAAAKAKTKDYGPKPQSLEEVLAILNSEECPPDVG